MTEQDQTPRPDDDEAMGHVLRRDDNTTDDDEATGHVLRRDDNTTDDDDDTTGHIKRA